MSLSESDIHRLVSRVVAAIDRLAEAVEHQTNRLDDAIRGVEYEEPCVECDDVGCAVCDPDNDGRGQA